MKPALRQWHPDGGLKTNLRSADIDEAEILFRGGLDTKEIADLFRFRGLDVWECDVANVLARRRDFARGDA